MSTITQLEKILSGWPNTALSVLLIGIGAFLILVGIVAPASMKLPIAVWAVL